jgi:hypothetical protein
MKLNTFLSLLLLSTASFGQKVLFTVGEDKTSTLTVIPDAESITDEPFELFSHYPCTDERQKEIFEDFDGLQTTISINGIEMTPSGLLEPYHTFSFQADEDETYHVKPSIQSEIPLQSMIQEFGKYMKATGNKLTINYIFKESIIATGEINFNVPQFNQSSGDFCQLKDSYITNEPSLISAITAQFKNEYSTYEIVKVWLPYALSNDGEGVEETTGLVLFKNGGDYGSIKYRIERKNGNISMKGNETMMITNIHPDCVKAFLAN